MIHSNTTPFLQCHRAAVSLVEVLVGSALMVVISVSVIEGITSTAQMSVMVESKYDIATDAERIMAEIGEDLARSGWHFPSFVDADYDPTTFAADRSQVYYPYVLMQSPTYPAAGGALDNGLPSDTFISGDVSLAGRSVNFVHARREGDLVTLSDNIRDLTGDQVLGDDLNHAEINFGAEGLTQTHYDLSFYARSQELIFLKAAVGDWTRDPNEVERQRLYFDGDTAQWQAPDPGAVDAYYNTQLTVHLNDGKSLLEAMDLASNDVFQNMYQHENNGVVRMDEFFVPIQTGDDTWKDELPSIEHDNATNPNLRRLNVLESPGAWIELSGANEVNIKVRWESKVPADQVVVETDANGAGQRMMPEQLREYMYAVVPSPIPNKRGRLVRCFSVNLGAGATEWTDNGSGVEIGDWISRDGNRAFVIDKILSDNVSRIVFDTYRTVTDGSIGLNEVRLRLYMATAYTTQDNRIVSYITESTFTMRTGNNSRQNTLNRDVLGNAGVGFDF